MRSLRYWLRPWLVVLLLCLIYAAVVMVAQNGPLALVTLGQRYADGDPALEAGTEGYDGQFSYYLAREGSLSAAAPYLDVPAYRAQRIVLPVMGAMLSFGQLWGIPLAFLLINSLAAAAGTYWLGELLAEQRFSRWAALAYGLSLGVWASTRLSLTEPLAYGLALGALYYGRKPDRSSLWSAAVLFALAGLTKETTLVLAAAYGLWLLVNKRWGAAVGFAAVVLGPFALWQTVLIGEFGTSGIGSGGALATSFEIVPFGGVIRIVIEGALPVLRTRGGTAFVSFILIFALTVGVFVLLPTLWGLLNSVRALRSGDTSLPVWVLLLTSGIMLFVPFSTYREPLGILRFIVGLQLAVLWFAAIRRKRRILNYSAVWMLTTLFVMLTDLNGGP